MKNESLCGAGIILIDAIGDIQNAATGEDGATGCRVLSALIDATRIAWQQAEPYLAYTSPDPPVSLCGITALNLVTGLFRLSRQLITVSTLAAEPKWDDSLEIPDIQSSPLSLACPVTKEAWTNNWGVVAPAIRAFLALFDGTYLKPLLVRETSRIGAADLRRSPIAQSVAMPPPIEDHRAAYRWVDTYKAEMNRLVRISSIDSRMAAVKSPAKRGRRSNVDRNEQFLRQFERREYKTVKALADAHRMTASAMAKALASARNNRKQSGK